MAARAATPRAAPMAVVVPVWANVRVSDGVFEVFVSVAMRVGLAVGSAGAGPGMAEVLSRCSASIPVRRDASSAVCVTALPVSSMPRK